MTCVCLGCGAPLTTAICAYCLRPGVGTADPVHASAVRYKGAARYQAGFIDPRSIYDPQTDTYRDPFGQVVARELEGMFNTIYGARP